MKAFLLIAVCAAAGASWGHAAGAGAPKKPSAAEYLSRGLLQDFKDADLCKSKDLADSIESTANHWEKEVREAVPYGNKAALDGMMEKQLLTETGLNVLLYDCSPSERPSIAKMVTKVHQARFSAAMAKIEIEEAPQEPPMW